MCFFMVFSSMSLAVPAPPAKFPPFLSSAGAAKKKKNHPVSSALNQNNYPKTCSTEPVRGEGNEAQRLLAITSLQSLLVISLLLWKRTRTAWEEAMCSRQTDGQTDRRRKGLMWLRCPESISDLWRLWQHNSSSGDWQHTGISLMFCLSGFLLSTDFKNTELVTLKTWELLKIPKHLLGSSLKKKKNPPGGRSVWGPVRICERFLEEFFVGHCGVPVWLQNGLAIKRSFKAL